jgi:hypothetical protein
MLRAVVGSEREDRCGGLSSKIDAVLLGASVVDLTQVFGQERVETLCLRGKQLDQGIVGRLRDRGMHGGAFACGGKASVTLVTANDRVHRIEDRDVDDRKRPGRSQGAELLGSLGRDRHVVERIGVKSNLIPVTDSVHTHMFSAKYLAAFRRGLVPWPPRVAMTSRETLRPEGVA